MAENKAADFVETYPNALSEQTCNSLISIFESSPNTSQSTTDFGGELSSQRRSTTLPLNSDNCGSLFNEMTGALRDSWELYRRAYSVLTDTPIRFENFGLYKYRDETEGYDWHADTDSPNMRYRFISVLIYLNTVTDGGETEFRYFPRKVQPAQGTLVLFPSSWTHVHRALPPLSGSKYVIVNWGRYGEYPLL